VRYWGAVAGALELAAGESEETSPFASLLSATRAPQPPTARELAAALAEALDSIDDHFILVLDDFQLISSKEVLGSFARFAEYPPERLRVIILSRCDPPLPMARLRAGGVIAEIRAEDLRFAGPTAHEEAEFITVRQLSVDEAWALTAGDSVSSFLTFGLLALARAS